MKLILFVMANGTGIKASQYKRSVQTSRVMGFIVVGNEDEKLPQALLPPQPT